MATATLAFSGFCLAQNSLNGRVCDSENFPLDFVAVRFLKQDSSFVKSTVTDSIGRYALNGIAEENGIICFSSVGFEPIAKSVSFSGSERLSVDVVMMEAAYALKEVVVVGQPIIRNEKGHLVAIPGIDQKRHSFGGYDLLNSLMIPGVTVDKESGEVSALFGNAALYINGIKASQREVKAIRAKDVVRVEYYDAPSGQYAGENAVVNFIVRETGGYAEVNGEQTIGYLDGTYNVASRISHKNTTFQIYGGYGLAEHDADRTDGTAAYHLAGDVIRQNTRTGNARVRNDKEYAQVDITNINKKRKLQASAFFNRDNAPFRRVTENIGYSNESGAGWQSKRRTETKSRGQKGNARLHGRFNFPGRQFFEVTMQGAYTKNNYSYFLKEEGIENELTQISNSSVEHRWDADITLAYGVTFKRGNSISVKFIDLFKDSRADYRGTNISRSSLWSNEELLFAQYVHPIGKRTRLMFQPGISALQYRQHGRDAIKLFAPRLNLRATTALTDRQFIMASCNIGNSFPNLASLSTAEQAVNALHIIRGNPDIDNTKLYQGLLVYAYNTGKLGIQVMAQYQYNHRLPVSCFSAEEDRIVESWRTDENSHYLNTNLSFTYRPLQALNLQISGGYNRYSYRGYQNVKAESWEGKFNGTYYFGNFSANILMSTPQVMMGVDLAKVTTPWKYGLSVSYAISHWRFEAGMENLFTKKADYRFTSFNPVYKYDNTLISRTASRHGFIKAAYTFDFGKSIKKEDMKPVENKLENALIKAR